MYKCTRCEAPLTDFDVLFQFNMFRNEDIASCECYRCKARGVPRRAASKYQEKKDAIDKVKKWIAVAFIVVFCLMVLADEIEFVVSISFLVFGIGFGVWAYNYIAIERPVPESETYVKGHHYESTVKDDGTIVTEQKTDYGTVGGDGCLMPIFRFVAVITAIFWIIPGLPLLSLSARSTFERECPKEFVRAYITTTKQVPRIMIPQRYQKAYKTAKEKSEEETKRIAAKYSIMGRETVQRYIQTVPPPMVRVSVRGKTYCIFDMKALDRDRNCYLLLQKSRGSLKGTILYGGYSVYSEGANWVDDWKEFGVSAEGLRMLDAYERRM